MLISLVIVVYIVIVYFLCFVVILSETFSNKASAPLH